MSESLRPWIFAKSQNPAQQFKVYASSVLGAYEKACLELGFFCLTDTDIDEDTPPEERSKCE